MAVQSVVRSVINSVIQSVVSSLNALRRWVYNNDGIDDYAILPNRAINVDLDIDIEWVQVGYDGSLVGAQTIVAQCFSTTLTAREFLLRVEANESLALYLGGNSTFTPVGSYRDGAWRVRLVGSTFEVWRNGQLVTSNSFTRGSIREPSAATSVGARNGGGTFSDFNKGVLFNLKINGVFWPIADRNQTIQLPSPAGLGAELITNGSNIPSNGWTYSNFILTADNVSQFATSGAIPVSVSGGTPYLLQFEVESLTPGGVVRVRIVGGTTIQIAQVNSIGSHRAIVTAAVGNGSINFQSQGSGVMSCVIKNISFRPLYTTNATEIVNNGDFSNGTTGWSNDGGATLTVNTGQANLTTVAGQNSRTTQAVTLEAGSYYQFSFDLVSLSGNANARLNVIRGAAGSFAAIGGLTTSTIGRNSFVLLAPASDAGVQVRSDSNATGSIVFDNVSIRKLDTLCNPLQMINTSSDRWQEIDG